MIAFLSKPSQYAVRALSELVIRTQDAAPGHDPRADYVVIGRLIEHTPLPPLFVAKIFSQFAAAGLLRSIIGRGGGYALGRPADQITLLDIVNQVEGGRAMDRCVLGRGRCNAAAVCPGHDSFDPTRQWLRQYLSTTTLANAAAAVRAGQAAGAKDGVFKGRRRPGRPAREDDV